MLEKRGISILRLFPALITTLVIFFRFFKNCARTYLVPLTMQDKYDKHQLLEVFEQAGLDLHSVIQTLNTHHELLCENVKVLSGIMDERTGLKERIRILELEVLIRILKKINQ